MKKANSFFALFFSTILFISCNGRSSVGTSSEVSGNPSIIKIGDQTWCIQNLDVSTYRNGDVIPNVQDRNAWANLNTGAWCYYENKTANGTIYGKLYNWFAVNDPRGLAPKGFHIPNNAEWKTLIDYLGGDKVAGGKMKETGNLHWESPNSEVSNTSGFVGLPGGCCSYSGKFLDICSYCYWWSSKEYDSELAGFRYIDIGNAIENNLFTTKKNGNSVRCLAD